MKEIFPNEYFYCCWLLLFMFIKANDKFELTTTNCHRCKVMIQAAETEEDETQEAAERPKKTVSGAIHAIWKREGPLGFFKGLQAQILKTVLSAALHLMIKEKITKTTWVLLLALRKFVFINRSRLKSA